MKTILALAVLMCAQFAFGLNLPDGTYEGRGTWKDKSGLIKSTVKMTYDKGEVKREWKGEGGRHYEGAFTLVTTPGSELYEIKAMGLQIGNGYCLHEICHAQFTIPQGTVDLVSVEVAPETYRLVGTQKSWLGEVASFEETLVKTN